MDESRTLRVLELFIYKLFTFLFHVMLISISCLERQANNTLLVISKVYHCNFYYIMKDNFKYKINYYKIIFSWCTYIVCKD